MNVIHIFSRFFIGVIKIFHLLQNEGHYTNAMVITYVGLRNDFKSANILQLIRNTT
jgi:hypothetical protein